VEIVQAALNANAWGDLGAVTGSELGLFELERTVRGIRNKLGELQSKEKLKIQLEFLIKRQEEVGAELKRWDEDLQRKRLSKVPEIGTIGPVFLTKGETKKLKHRLDWLQYPKDELVVKLTVIDKDKKPVPAEVLGMPAQMKLTFETHQLAFEYDVKAGAKEGNTR